MEASERVLAFIRRQKGLENVEIIDRASEVGVRETYRVVGEKPLPKKRIWQAMYTMMPLLGRIGWSTNTTPVKVLPVWFSMRKTV